MRVLVLFTAWIVITLFIIASVPAALVALISNNWMYATRILLAQDKLVAAVWGWSGLRTISAECGKSECRFCKWVCRMLERAERNHCTDAMKDETWQIS